MKTIYTHKGEEIFVDDEDYSFLNCHAWCLDGKGYPCSRIDSISYRIHQVLVSKHGLIFRGQLDHEDRNKCNNQKSNFRSATGSQNMANQGLRVDNSSGYKGVVWDVLNQKYSAKIQYKSRQIYLGSFDSAIKAAEQYDFAAHKFFGKFACCNFEEKSDAATV